MKLMIKTLVACHSEPKRNKMDVDDRKSLCEGTQSIKLGDRFRLDGHGPSYADFHPQVVSDVKNGPLKSKEFREEQQAQGKADEVVRYMSNLPSYLERGEKHKDKTFNVGVLEWRRLEKWQYNQRHQSCRSSPSSSNTSSFSPTEGSSSYSSRAHSCSPARQRPHHNMLDSNLNASPSKVYSHAIKTSEKMKSRELRDIPSDYLKLQQSILRTHQCFNKYTGNKPKECKSNNADPQNSSEKRRLREPENQCAASTSKGKLKVKDGELLVEKQGPDSDHVDPRSIDRQQTVVILLPKDGQEVRCPAYSNDREEIETSQRSFVHESSFKVNELSSVISQTCPLSSEADISQVKTQNKKPSSIGKESIKFPSEPSQPIPYPGRLSVSPVRDKNLEEKKAINKLKSSTHVSNPRRDIAERNHKVNEISSDVPCSFHLSSEVDLVAQPQNQADRLSSPGPKGLKFPHEVSQSMPYSCKSSVSPVRDKKLVERKSAKKLNCPTEVPKSRTGTGEDGKVRHPSPIRRLSFSMGRTGRNPSSKDSCPVQSMHPTTEISSRGAETSDLPVDSSSDKSNAPVKGRSSPLRRLLDPFLRPRAGNSDMSNDSKQRTVSQIDRGSKLSGGRGETSALHSVKVKLDLGSCKSIDIDHPSDLGKCGSTMVQALLQVAVKNGLPLFTFAVDHSSDILAATMKKLSSGRRDGSNFIYTFFVVHETKKKNGNWLTHGSKDKNHDYISDIVGQMKVSDVLNTGLPRENIVDQSRIREFVLIAANTRPADKKTSDLQANDELAAIVVKLPKMTAKPMNDSGPKKCHSKKLSTGDLKESPQEVCGHFDFKAIEGSGSFSRSIDLLGLTVILPGGNHGVPVKGKPSSLIERWRRGGTCDCGGWDMGCRLRVFANAAQLDSGFSNRSQPPAGKLKLYSQVI